VPVKRPNQKHCDLAEKSVNVRKIPLLTEEASDTILLSLFVVINYVKHLLFTSDKLRVTVNLELDIKFVRR